MLISSCTRNCDKHCELDSTKYTTTSNCNAYYYKPIHTDFLTLKDYGKPKTKLILSIVNKKLYIEKFDGKDNNPIEFNLTDTIVYRLFHSVDKFLIIASECPDSSEKIIKGHWAKHEMNFDNIKHNKYFMLIYKERIKTKEHIVLTAGVGTTQPRNGRIQYYYGNLQAATAPGIRYYIQLKENTFTIFEMH